MSQRQDILQQALGLPPEDREFVVAVLEHSLAVGATEYPPDAIGADSPAAVVGDDFLKELQRRSAAFRSGHTAARPATEVLNDLRRRQADEASS